jgi:hypothetical protein
VRAGRLGTSDRGRAFYVTPLDAPRDADEGGTKAKNRVPDHIGSGTICLPDICA